MGRKLKTALTLLHPDMRANALLKRLKQKIVHDGGARTTPPVRPGDYIYARNFRSGPTWMPARVTDRATDNIADVVLSDGRCWRRHQEHLRPNFAPCSAPPGLPPERQTSSPTPVLPPVQQAASTTERVSERAGVQPAEQLVPLPRKCDSEQRNPAAEPCPESCSESGTATRDLVVPTTHDSTPMLRISTTTRKPVVRF